MYRAQLSLSIYSGMITVNFKKITDTQVPIYVERRKEFFNYERSKSIALVVSARGKESFLDIPVLSFYIKLFGGVT